MEENKSGERNELIDIIKGILIVLVVFGHTNNFLVKWIYSFHMAAFFSISGYLVSKKIVDGKKNIFKYIWKRINRLYIPFVVVNCLFISLNNVFVKVGFYTTSKSFAILTSGWPVNQIGSVFSISQMVKNCLKSFFLIGGHAPLVGVSWYLATLFIISLLHIIPMMITKKWNTRNKIIFYMVLFLLCLIASYFGDYLGANLIGGWIVRRIFPAYSAFLIGYIIKFFHPFKANKVRWLRYAKWGVVSIGIIMVVFDSRKIDLANGNIVNPIYYLVGLFQGMVIIMAISRLLMNSVVIKNVIIYFGQKSMSIMLFHFMAFKIVNYLLIWIYDLDVVYLASRPVIYDVHAIWSLLYLFVGICVPVCVDLLLDFFKNRIKFNSFFKCK